MRVYMPVPLSPSLSPSTRLQRRRLQLTVTRMRLTRSLRRARRLEPGPGSDPLQKACVRHRDTPWSSRRSVSVRALHLHACVLMKAARRL